jgi:hypothetical protein
MRARRMMIPAAVLAASAALLAPTAAQAAPQDEPMDVGQFPTFGDAYTTFIKGGQHLGQGAAEVVAGAYTGIANTPALIAYSFVPQA